MFCNKCGNNLGDVEGVRFCNKCGNDLSGSVNNVQEEAKTIVNGPETPNNVIRSVDYDANIIQSQVVNDGGSTIDLEKRKRNKKSFIITAVVCSTIAGIIGLLLISLLIVSVVTAFGRAFDLLDDAQDRIDSLDDPIYENNYDYDYDDSDFDYGSIFDNEEDEETEEDNTEVASDEQRVGSKSQGYVTVPDSWKENDTGYDGMLQYLNQYQGSVTLYSVDTSLLSAKAYADSVEDTMPSQGIDEVSRKEVTIAGYDAYKLWGYSDTLNIWLTVWVFEAEDDQTHYLAVETLTEDSEYLDIAETFSLDK